LGFYLIQFRVGIMVWVAGGFWDWAFVRFLEYFFFGYSENDFGGRLWSWVRCPPRSNARHESAERGWGLCEAGFSNYARARARINRTRVNNRARWFNRLKCRTVSLGLGLFARVSLRHLLGQGIGSWVRRGAPSCKQG
jgi:hypothetical protein